MTPADKATLSQHTLIFLRLDLLQNDVDFKMMIRPMSVMNKSRRAFQNVRDAEAYLTKFIEIGHLAVNSLAYSETKSSCSIQSPEPATPSRTLMVKFEFISCIGTYALMDTT